MIKLWKKHSKLKPPEKLPCYFGIRQDWEGLTKKPLESLNQNKFSYVLLDKLRKIKRECPKWLDRVKSEWILHRKTQLKAFEICTFEEK